MTAPSTHREPIAIIGMGCRYPGAPDIASFWRVLRDGIDTVTDVPRDRWDADALHDPDPAARAKICSRRGGFVDGIESFDAAFFGISPREAPHVDPRQRLIMEASWQALEAAGIPPDSLAGSSTGVYIATLTNDYFDLLFDDLQRIESWSGAGTANSIIANRLSYFLDLHGPSMTLDTACSGSLVAIHLACHSLRCGESTLAIAGGVSVNLTPDGNVFFSRAGALSRDGVCRTFDRDAGGIVRSDGAGVVVLKTLSQAIADGDPIVAVIAGTAVNHDGRSNGIMAPNGNAQRAVLACAYRDAGVAPAGVQYVEAHGTGTPLGDPIEVQALGDFVGTKGCVLGSLKTNFGHTEAAAGVAGVIKTALAMQHRLLPPTVHFREPNPLIPFGRLPYEVRTTLGPWPRGNEPLVAGVSAFGFGGTNAHVVMREAPPCQRAGPLLPPYILPLSAQSGEALSELAGATATALEDQTLDPGDACFTAATGRKHHPVRIAVVGESREELRRELLAASPGTQSEGLLAFVFSGQGSQWSEMGMQLHAREPVYRAMYDRVAPRVGSLDETDVAQRSIFAVQVALAALWRSWGIEPDIVVGHGLGEAAAACVAGALSPGEAAQIVAHRGRLMKRAAGKGRASVAALTLDQACALERRGVTVAGSNSPGMTVLSGAPAAIEALAHELEERGTFCQLLTGIDIAFHSPQMEPLARELVELLSNLRPAPATIPILSTVTGGVIDGTLLDGRYWGRNLREPFLFSAATAELLRRGVTTVVEVSPHPVLASAITETASYHGASLTVLPSLRRGGDEALSMLRSLAALYAEGRDVRWREVLHGGRRVAMPHYPFQRQRYWFDQLDSNCQEPHVPQENSEHPLLGARVEAADAPSTAYWERELGAGHPRWIADHRIFGEPVLPGAAWLDMALAAARQFDPDASIEDVTFDAQLHLRERRRVQVVAADGVLALYSRGASDSSWTRHATARVSRPVRDDAGAATAGLAAARARCSVVADPGRHYDSMAEGGVVYGPAFRLFPEARVGGREAVAVLTLPPQLGDVRHLVHPALLDAALRVIAPALPSGASYLPVAVSAFDVRAASPARLTCQAIATGEQDDVYVDITLFDDADQIVASIRGLALRRTALARASALDAALIELQWEPRLLAAGAPRRELWRVEGEDVLAGELASRLYAVAGDPETIVHFGASVEDALVTAQTARACGARLVFITRGGVCAAALHGLAAAIAMEEPELACRCIDIDGTTTAEELERELLLGGNETRTIWRAGVRSVGRIAPVAAPAAAVSILAGATYLITGAFGALGVRVAESLIERGARHLLLVSRRGAAGNAQALARLARGGAEIVAVAADVAIADDVARVFAQAATMPPLRGIVHAAGVLHDALLADQSPATLREVLAPKADGAWNLHLATESLPLDFFILFASAASLLGSAGQANYAAANAVLDALAHHRRARGLTALSIDWGAFNDGMAADGFVLRRFAARGVRPIEIRDALDLLWRLAAADSAQIGVVPVDWPLFLRQFPRGVPPLFERMTSAPSQEAARVRDEIMAAGHDARERLLFEHVRDTLFSVLGFDRAVRVTPHQRFFDLGMDSLTAVELRNALEATFDVSLPATIAIDHPTLDTLARHLATLLWTEEANDPERAFDGVSDDELAQLLAQELGDAG